MRTPNVVHFTLKPGTREAYCGREMRSKGQGTPLLTQVECRDCRKALGMETEQGALNKRAPAPSVEDGGCWKCDDPNCYLAHRKPPTVEALEAFWGDMLEDDDNG